jgi:2'-5' RNA ligase
MRTFIAVEIPEEIKEEILEIQKQLPELKVKFTEREKLHITLKFLGEINEDKIEEVKKRLREIKYKSFEVKLDKIGFLITKIEALYGFMSLTVKNCKEKLTILFADYLRKKKDL